MKDIYHMILDHLFHINNYLDKFNSRRYSLLLLQQRLYYLAFYFWKIAH